MFDDIAASLRKLHALTLPAMDPADLKVFRALRVQLVICLVFLLGAQFAGGHLWIAGCAALGDGAYRAALIDGWQATLKEEQRAHAILLENPGRKSEPLPVSWLAAIGPDGQIEFERGDGPEHSAAQLLDRPLRRALLEITALKVRDFAQDRARAGAGDPTATPANSLPLLWHYVTALNGRPYLLSLTTIRDAEGFPVREGLRLVATDLEAIAGRIERQLHLHPIEIRGAAAWLPALISAEIALEGFREDEVYYARLTPRVSWATLARATLHALLAGQLVLALLFLVFALPHLYVRMRARVPGAETKSAQPVSAPAPQQQPEPETEPAALPESTSAPAVDPISIPTNPTAPADQEAPPEQPSNPSNDDGLADDAAPTPADSTDSADMNEPTDATESAEKTGEASS